MLWVCAYVTLLHVATPFQRLHNSTRSYLITTASCVGLNSHTNEQMYPNLPPPLCPLPFHMPLSKGTRHATVENVTSVILLSIQLT